MPLLNSQLSSQVPRVKAPVVSVGMPVYNGESTLAAAIESILSQSFADFELIISDNASTDKTEDICRAFASRDDRIRYIRQSTNIGPANNFKFVLELSSGQYFMWAAADDTRTPGFIQTNLNILESNPDIVFSSSPNCFEGEESQSDKHVSFDLCGTLCQRFIGFLDVSTRSHACFYSLMRGNVIKNVPDLSAFFLASDWLINLHMLSKGKFGRSNDELFIINRNGTSNQKDFLRKIRKRPIELFFPFFEFSKRFICIVKNSSELTFAEKNLVLLKIIRFNFRFNYRNFVSKALGIITRF